MSSRSLLVLFPFILFVSACQQIAWKAGATAEDLKRDEHTCRAQTPASDADIRQCLHNKGWTIANTGASLNDDAVIDSPEERAATTAQTPFTTTQTPATTNQAPASPLSQSVSHSPSTPAHAADTEKTATATPNPLRKQSVQSWWKAGAQASDFNIDINSCLTQLGEQHTPDYTQHLYTRAMTDCLRTHGWFAGSNPTFTPLR
jgi:hypothetical protein